MKQLMKVAALSMFCLALSACGEPKHIVTAIPTPPERLVCEARGTRPAIPPEYVIDWGSVTSVAQARAEHEKFVATLRTREGVTAGYILQIEDKLFICWNNMQWRREFEAGLPTPPE